MSTCNEPAARSIAEIDARIAEAKRLHAEAADTLALLERERRAAMDSPAVFHSTPHLRSKKTIEIDRMLDADGDLHIRIAAVSDVPYSQTIYLPRPAVAAVVAHLQGVLAVLPDHSRD